MSSCAPTQSSYGNFDSPIRSARKIEYEIFAQVTGRLSEAQRRKDVDYPEFIRALGDNMVLWRTLVVDVMSSGNSLPENVRNNMLCIFSFCDRHSRRIMNNEADITALVDINIIIMKGLRGEGN